MRVNEKKETDLEKEVVCPKKKSLMSVPLVAAHNKILDRMQFLLLHAEQSDIPYFLPLEEKHFFFSIHYFYITEVKCTKKELSLMP